jgi:hypothetical protein
MLDPLTTIIVSTAIGTVSALIVEAAVKPRVTRRSVAEIFATDLSLHMQAVIAELAQVADNPKRVPLPRPMPTVLFSANVARIGELPRTIIGDLVALYRILDRLNEIADRAGEALRSLEGIGSSDETTRTIREDDLAGDLALYRRYLENAVQRMNSLQPRIIKVATPWWSPRFWFTPAAQMLNSAELTRRVFEMRSSHDAAKEEIKRS